MGWPDLRYFGSDHHETPVLDKLAIENMVFTDSYAASPVCSTTRTSILTGKYSGRVNITTYYENSGDCWSTLKRNDDRISSTNPVL